MRLRDSLGTGLAAIHTVIIAFGMVVCWGAWADGRSAYWLLPILVDFPVSILLVMLGGLCLVPLSGLPLPSQNLLAWLFTYGLSLVGGGAWWFIVGWWLHGPTDPTAPNPALE